MKTRWVEKNVDLGQLYNCMESFLKKGGFAVSFRKSNGEALFSASKSCNESLLTIIVNVEGKPSDFSVEVRCRNVPESALMFSQFLSMFGLGGLLVKKLNLLDVYKAFEENFWAFMDEAISSLEGSAK